MYLVGAEIRFNFKSNLKNRRKKNLMLMWKIVEASKVLVLYIYIDKYLYNSHVRFCLRNQGKQLDQRVLFCKLSYANSSV